VPLPATASSAIHRRFARDSPAIYSFPGRRGIQDSSAMNSHQSADSAARFVRTRLDWETSGQPVIGIILGSGLGAAADRLVHAGGTSLACADIPGMPVPHVVGHSGRLAAGRVGSIPVLMLQGRAHTYEGHDWNAVTFGVRLLAALGTCTLVVSNAAGGIRPEFRPGDLMLIRDHLRLPWHWTRSGNPGTDTRSSSQAEVTVRPPVWNVDLLARIRDLDSSLTVHDGVYAMMPGPNYETPAEIRLLARLGADAVGMSTVPEALAASVLGLRVLGVSCITNVAAGLSAELLSHHDVTSTAAAVESRFVDWLWRAIEILGQSEPRLMRP
jgi:purine-nucleoside phosphorylase